MDRIAVNSPTDRRDLFQVTADRRGLSPMVIEKDFWVCWVLKHLFALPAIGPNLIFKGGTSLSKVFRLIRRFSEDIDVSIRRDSLGFEGQKDPEQAASKSQQRRLVAELRAECSQVVQYKVKDALTAVFTQVLGAGNWTLESDPDDPKTLNFAYPPTIGADAPGAAYIRRNVKLEMGAGSDPYPLGSHSIQPYASEEFPSAFDAPYCDVIVLDAERTFWEKATLLHAEFHRPQGGLAPIRLSRHLYDLAQVAASDTGERAMRNLPLLERVAKHKSVYFESSWAHYETAIPGSLRLLPPDTRLDEFRRDYARMNDMFFSEYPAFDVLLASISHIEQAINDVRPE